MPLAHFNWVASVYDRVMAPPDPARLHDRLRLPTAGGLLEVGGGTGRAVERLRPEIGQLVISDLSGPMLREACAKGNGRLVQSYAEQLPFGEASFERVLVVDALHHFHDQRAAVSELWRVLKPGGRLVLEEVDVTRLTGRLIALAEKLALMGSRFYPPRALGALVLAWSPTAQVETDGQATVWVTADKPVR
jgi:ubiquinone/menaquinone biosynthesis C-methylase UbiE